MNDTLTAPVAATAPALRKIETVTCSRCGGHGKLDHFGHVHNGVCFKCGGSGHKFTKRGAAANAYLISLRSKPAKDFKPGDLSRQTVGYPNQVTAFFTVESVTPVTEENATCWSIVDGKKVVPAGQVRIEFIHPKHGGLTSYQDGNTPMRFGCTAEFKAQTLRKALDFQDTLNKNGTVKKSK